MARNFFLSGEFPEISESDFQMATKTISGIDNGKLYLSLDGLLPLESGSYSHYLLYGSEHFLKIAISLTEIKKSIGGRDYRQALKKNGVPTLFRVALPFEMVTDLDIEQFLKIVKDDLWYQRQLPNPDRLDFTFTLSRPLPPNHLLDHKHPTSIAHLPCDFF
jgi:hypothetical protein